MKLSQLFLLTGFILFTMPLHGAEVSKEDARKVAVHFTAGLENTWQVTQENQILLHHTIENANNPLMYIFNIGQQGFVIVSAEDEVYPVLGWSLEGAYGLAPEPLALLEWLKSYHDQIVYIRKNDLKGDESIRIAWEQYLSEPTLPGEKSSHEQGKSNNVDPLLTARWDQGIYYNHLCPNDSMGPGNKVYAGCVATAMAQVMYYYRYPESGTGSSSYYHSTYGTLSANYGNTQYRWNEMSDIATGKNYLAIAELLYQLGISVEMNYSPSGSGAYSADAAYSLVSHFGYDPSLTIVYKSSYSNTNWINLLKSNLNNGHPMYYHGYGSGGHAFNVDGYQNDDHFHFNWGWSGSYNGYYYLNNLNPGSSSFTNGQGAIINFKPPTTSYPSYCTGAGSPVTSVTGSLEDGSGPLHEYQNQTNCSWLIQPTGAISHIDLRFQRFSLENGNDFLYIYDGIDDSAPLIATLTGDSVYSSIVTTGGAAFLKFTTNGSTTSNGWLLDFEGYHPVFCTNLQTFNDPQGTFNDGSGTFNYNNNTNCKFFIKPSGHNNIHLKFNRFELENGRDFLKIYNPSTTPSTLIATLTGNTIPPDIFTTSGQLLLIFITDNANTEPGWEITYTTPIGIEEQNKSSMPTVYPNPATEQITIVHPNNISPESINLYDLSGRLVMSVESAPGTAGHTVADLSSLKSGIYLLTLIGSDYHHQKRLVVRR